MQLWLVNLLTTSLGKFVSQTNYTDGLTIVLLPIVIWFTSDIANVFEESFIKGLSDTNERGKEIEKELGVNGIFTRTREIYKETAGKGQTISSAMQMAYNRLVIAWAIIWPILALYVTIRLYL